MPTALLKYIDFSTGAELFSDIYKIKDINGVLYEVEGKVKFSTIQPIV